LLELPGTELRKSTIIPKNVEPLQKGYVVTFDGGEREEFDELAIRHGPEAEDVDNDGGAIGASDRLASAALREAARRKRKLVDREAVARVAEALTASPD
jgi:hypothetical protein